jgi:hypothetical protein
MSLVVRHEGGDVAVATTAVPAGASEPSRRAGEVTLRGAVRSRCRGHSGRCGER